jgi:hypothetical protein
MKAITSKWMWVIYIQFVLAVTVGNVIGYLVNGSYEVFMSGLIGVVVFPGGFAWSVYRAMKREGLAE